ncbi:Ferrous iron transport protein B [Slackia heliotrinireducens]|uniref:Ferrous iron transport protein B n=1 Tax=Slackia heliotrinireducens (strain ATCC 29202 / DSM 20476 / NCTC 11029 / RHS 1) TaxID=471855 RepID=C7N7A6_SLAHD|nr:ferrous iron transport protein B [Slackia heliotrinireducens]ACV22791.1 small GTP-binding protein domain protein [Slackia heliotrinireducens DSM 20476]VEH01484.1 Ferrous iron transport protein B [Slackia heliotrinireducens]
MEATLSLALLGQPNSGKSTLFNGLTGSHQKVGNWPGKTVEKKLGTCTRSGTTYTVCDLPGAYSLSAMSDEEQITQAYIESGEADVVCVMVDASQLSRSLYMLADFVGTKVPAVLVLNMMDVAKDQGKRINAGLLEQRLGIPVVPFVANDSSYYDAFMKAVDKAAANKTCVDSQALRNLYAHYSPEWTAAYEGLAGTRSAKQERFDDVWLAAQQATQSEDGATTCAFARFKWVDQMLENVQVEEGDAAPAFMKWLDAALMHPRWGKPAGVLTCLVALLGAMLIGSPLMMLGQIPVMLSGPLASALTAIGLPAFVTNYLSSALMTALFFVFSMAGFVFGVTFVFGILDEIGIVARISYLFDGTMARLGLPGKVMMPFLSGFGCNIASVHGMRVVDSWGQRMLGIAMCWAVPCGSTMSIIPVLAFTFFGFGGMILVVLGMALGVVLVMLLVAKVFGRRLVPEEERAGLVMELPPYHRPKFKHIFILALRRYKSLAWRAFKVIFVITTVFWLLTYSGTGSIEDSFLYIAGSTLEPITRFFGMGWRLFIAFLSSLLAKEAMLGVLAALFASADPNMLSAASGASAAGFSLDMLVGQVSPAEALAFMFACTFNVPCVMVLGSTRAETHSLKWTAIIALFYFCLALCISFVVYHVAVLFL